MDDASLTGRVLGVAKTVTHMRPSAALSVCFAQSTSCPAWTQARRRHGVLASSCHDNSAARGFLANAQARIRRQVQATRNCARADVVNNVEMFDGPNRRCGTSD